MIDSVAFVWGGLTGSIRRRERVAQHLRLAAGHPDELVRAKRETQQEFDARLRRANRPSRRSRAERARAAIERGDGYEVVAAPLRLDFNELAGKLGSGGGEVKSQAFNGDEKRYGHWKVGHVDVMYSEPTGRLELRASLPKLLVGQNDVVLSESGVRDALARLIDIGAEAIGRELVLEEARPARLDLCYQWEVDSVAAALGSIRRAFAPVGISGRPARLTVTEISSPRGGQSLVYGYGSKRVLRFYDKARELAEQGEESAHDDDRLLRFELQERRGPRLRDIHEKGYQALDVRLRLRHELEPMKQRTIDAGSLAAYLDQAGGSSGRRVRAALGDLWAAQNPHIWPLIKTRVHRSTYYELRRNARAAQLDISPWLPEIPADAFDDDLEAA